MMLARRIPSQPSFLARAASILGGSPWRNFLRQHPFERQIAGQARIVRNWARYGADWAAARGDDHVQIRLAARRFFGMMPPIARRCRSPLTESNNCTATGARSGRLVFDVQQHDQN